jgi:DNA (cytosine-5)-methyltransferase 1
MHAVRNGVPQRRRRFFLAASLDGLPTEAEFNSMLSDRERSLSWAVGDLLDHSGEDSTYETSARHSIRNQERIRYLFEHGIYDLPDSERPDCHRLKKHSYRSVYGRMAWDQATPTITTGFGSTGQGRYVHPLRERTLTPHEAARVQFIPDFFRFPPCGRGALQEMIGNAVPPKLSYAMLLPMLAR